MAETPSPVFRSKTVTWSDPIALAGGARSLSGSDFLRAMAAGELPPPPIANLLNMTVQSISEGEVTFGCRPDESVYNPIGMVHGGLVCTLLDTVTGCAVHTTLPAGVGYTSIEISVQYLRPVHAGIDLTARGWVTKPGRRVAFAQGDVRDSAGSVLATASSSCLILSGGVPGGRT